MLDPSKMIPYHWGIKNMTVHCEVFFNIIHFSVNLCGGRDIIRDDCDTIKHSSLLQLGELRVIVDRAGYTVGEDILLCGSWDTEGTIRDNCMSYNILREPGELQVGLDRAGATVVEEILLCGTRDTGEIIRDNFIILL